MSSMPSRFLACSMTCIHVGGGEPLGVLQVSAPPQSSAGLVTCTGLWHSLPAHIANPGI